MNQKLYLAVGLPGDKKQTVIPPIVIEDFNRDEVKELICEAIDLVYDTEDDYGDYETIEIELNLPNYGDVRDA